MFCKECTAIDHHARVVRDSSSGNRRVISGFDPEAEPLDVLFLIVLRVAGRERRARLLMRGLVTRERSTQDRRRVLVKPTEAAASTIERGPPLLQEDFSRRFEQLEDWEQTQLLASLQRIAALMDAGRIDAAPVLAAGTVKASSEAV